MLLRKLKWRGEPEPSLVWEHYVDRLGEDEHGEWFFAPRGTRVRHADGTTHEQWADALIVFAPDQVAYLWRPDPAGPHGDLRVTVDVAERVAAPTYVDLELDVFAYGDGRVEGRDEDEFAELCATGALDGARVDAARNCYDDLLRSVAVHPRFTLAGTRWWREAGV